jgi:hypothetical protein
MYFTDVIYGYLQDFRPAPGLPSQVYRFNPKTGLVGVVADGFNKPNGTLSFRSALLVSDVRYHFLAGRYLCLHCRYWRSEWAKRSEL